MPPTMADAASGPVPSTTVDEATPEPIEWQASAADGAMVTRKARLPRVIFMR